MSKEYLQEIQKLVDETAKESQETKETVLSQQKIQQNPPHNNIEAEADFLLTPKTTQKKSLSKTELRQKYPYAHPHGGHRKRVKKSVESDPDFATFSEIEILEYLLFQTVPRINTNEHAHELLDAFGSLSGVLNAQVDELKAYSFINENTARMLTAIIPAARRAEISRQRNYRTISNIAQAVDYMAPYYLNRMVEYVYLTCISNSDRVISVERIAVGDTNYATIDVKRIVEQACKKGATKVLLSHNHPSGNLEPSKEDRQLTTRIIISLISLNIMLVDHIIFAGDNYYSFFANREFESMYEYADKMFNTGFVKEMRSKVKNYRKILLNKIEESDMKEAGTVPVFNQDIEHTSYTALHPDPFRRI